MKIPAPWPLETQSPLGCLGAGPANRCLWILPHGVQVAKGRLSPNTKLISWKGTRDALGIISACTLVRSNWSCPKGYTSKIPPVPTDAPSLSVT